MILRAVSGEAGSVSLPDVAEGLDTTGGFGDQESSASLEIFFDEI